MTYSADGTKLRQTTYTNGQAPQVMDYSTGYIYKDRELQYFAHEEGRCLRTSTTTPDAAVPNVHLFRYEYNLTDHLGNVRISFADTDNDGKAEVLQEQHYEAYGLRLGGLVFQDGEENRFTYSGKERIGELGLGWSDFGARMYNPAIGRWNGVDALAEKYMGMNPYMYVAGNPIRLTDIDGRDFEIGGNIEQSKRDVLSILPENLRKYVRFNKNGTVSFHYIKARKALGDKKDAGTELLHVMTKSKKKYLYEAATETTVRNRETGEAQKENTFNLWATINASTTDYDKDFKKDSELNHLPKEGYDGQVMIDPDAKFYESGLGPFSPNPTPKDRGDIIYHELEENVLRTEGNGDGQPLYYHATDNLPGAHDTAIKKAKNYHNQDTKHGSSGGFTTSPQTTQKITEKFEQNQEH